MILINLLHGQGLGNQLWNIFTAKQLSLINNCDLHIAGYKNFKGSGFIDFDCENIDFNNVSTQYKFSEDLFYDKKLRYVNSGYDKKFIKLKPPFEIDGLFQDERYITPLINNPKNFIKISRSNLNLSDNVCVLNIRGGEFKHSKNLILPITYWKMAMNYMRNYHKIKDFLIVTDDIAYARKLFPSIPLISNSIKDCFSALMEAQYVITSNSSFSYFPIALSSPKRFILSPKFMCRYSANTTWCSFGNIYDGYHYLDKFGSVTTADQNKHTLIEASEQYNRHNILVSTDDIFEVGFKRIFSKNFRKYIKKVLVRYFPSRF